MASGELLWRRPVLQDAAVAGFLFAASLGLPISTHDWALIPLILAMTAPLVLRRRYPIQVFAATCAAGFVQWLTFPQLGPYDIAVLVALYSVAAHRTWEWSGPALIIGLTGALLAWSAAKAIRDVSTRGLIAPTLIVVAVWTVGRTMRARRIYLAELEQRAIRLEREQDALARAAVAEERARIAREMHDVVAHSVAVMVAQAEGASVAVRTAPEAAERALEVISEAGRNALSELRRTLGMLRQSSTPNTAPQPDLSDLDALVASMRASGLPVRFVREGDEDPVPPSMALAVYRIVQESLTNTLKHAGPQTPTQLRLCQTPAALEVDVTDLGVKADRRGEAGQGLAGIHERVAMFGGQSQAGPTPSGGWRVHALIPLKAGTS